MKAALKKEPAADRKIDLGLADVGLAARVEAEADANLRECYQCFACSGGCPFYESMDYGPHGIMRRVHLGLREDVLESNTIWLCVGCHTCSSVCPMSVDVAAVMDSLRRMALEEGVRPAEPSILEFHRQVLGSVERYGRTHKLEIMLRHKAKTRDFLSDWDVGLKMLAKRKLDLRPSRIRNAKKTLGHLFRRAWRP